MPKRRLKHKTSLRKDFPNYVRQTQRRYSAQQVEFWAMDEHRIGLKPILRRTWSPRGQRPVVLVNHRYAWSYLYGFVQPRTGRSFYLLMPTVSIAAFNVALHEFAVLCDAGPDKHISLLMDCAPWHTSSQLVFPDGIQPYFLPAYSPELQPAEHLWPLTNAPLANQCFTSLDELEAIQVERCLWLQDQPELVRSATCFHWWPDPPLH